MANQYSPHRLVVQACLAATLSYLAARLGGALILRPQMVSPLWLGNVLLVAVLLLVRREIRPVLLVAGLAGFFLFDLQTGLPIRSTAWLILSNAVEVLIATLCLSNSFGGVPRLNSVKALVKYSFWAVFLAPFLGAFLGAMSTPSNYWASWKVAFFSEALGFLTLMPAALGWATEIPAWRRRPHSYYMEATALLGALLILGSLAFAGPGGSSPPALLYSLVPLLLWATLRFGSTGVSTSMIAIAFVSILGAVHSRGPFTEPGPHVNVLSLQLFLFFTAAPFMALAGLSEERQDAVRALRYRDSELNEAQRLAQIGSWKWEPSSDATTWSAELYSQFERDPELPAPSLQDHQQFLTPESWDRLKLSTEKTLQTGVAYELDLEGIRPNGARFWFTNRGEAVVDGSGSPVYLRGTAQNITARKQAGEALRESEEKFRRIFEDAGVGMVIVSPRGRFLAANRTFCAYLGYTEEELLQKTVQSITLPEDWPTFSWKLAETLTQGSIFQAVEKRCLHKHGRIVSTESSASLIRGSSSEPLYLVGVVVDITERKMAEQALSSINRKLIEAQEQERTRIARELHDDIGQRLALLTIELEQLRQDSLDLPVEVRSRMGALGKQASDIATDTQSLSHELHSSKLEQLGVVVAVRSFCREFGAQQKVEVDFTTHNVPSTLPTDTSLCLFRVLQESLRNSAKHSGVNYFEVRLWGTSGEIHLTVRDSGSGFDSEVAKKSLGLGLISMEERLKLLQGTLSIQSQPQRGTTIHACLPLSAGTDSMRTAG